MELLLLTIISRATLPDITGGTEHLKSHSSYIDGAFVNGDTMVHGPLPIMLRTSVPNLEYALAFPCDPVEDLVDVPLATITVFLDLVIVGFITLAQRLTFESRGSSFQESWTSYCIFSASLITMN